MKRLTCVVWLALATAAAGLVCGVAARQQHATATRIETWTGRVTPLAELLKKSGLELDPEASPHWLALVTDDGKLYPLVKDAASRPFYRDSRLLHRPVRIQGRFVPGSQLLQVLQLHSLKEGKPHEVFYWCDVCSIKRFSLDKVCECCGGPMELRETPAAK